MRGFRVHKLLGCKVRGFRLRMFKVSIFMGSEHIELYRVSGFWGDRWIQRLQHSCAYKIPLNFTC